MKHNRSELEERYEELKQKQMHTDENDPNDFYTGWKDYDNNRKCCEDFPDCGCDYDREFPWISFIGVVLVAIGIFTYWIYLIITNN